MKLYRTPQEIKEHRRAYEFSEVQQTNDRLKQKYGNGKGIGYASFKFIGKVEELIWDFDSADNDLEREIAMSVLFEVVEPKLKAWAKYLTYTKYDKFKLMYEDFYSVVLVAFWETLNKVTPPEYSPWETFELVVEERAKGFVHRATKQLKFERTIRPVDITGEEYTSVLKYEPMKHADFSLLCEQMLNEPSLTPEEREVLAKIINDPDTPLREFTDHPQTAKRIVNRIGSKLAKYKEEL